MNTYSFLLYLLDLSIAWAISGFTIYSVYELCIDFPFAILITACLEVLSLLISWNLLNIPIFIKNKFSARNVHKKILKFDSIPLRTHLITEDQLKSFDTKKTELNLTRSFSALRYESIFTVSKYRPLNSYFSAKHGEPGMMSRSSTFSDLIKTQEFDLESNQLTPSVSFSDNPSLVRSFNGSARGRRSEEIVLSSSRTCDSPVIGKDKTDARASFGQYYKSAVKKLGLNRDTFYSKPSFWEAINLWIKINVLSPIINNSVWAISDIIITVIWCITWQWAASHMRRDPDDFSLLTWKLDGIPKFYWQLDASFQCSAVLHYCLFLYYSDYKLKYILSFNGIIDFITTPSISLILSNIYPVSYKRGESRHNHWLLILGPIRFLRLLKTESLIFKNFYWLSEVKVVIIGVICNFLSILFTFTGLLFLLESPRVMNSFEQPFDFLYFGLVTIGTGKNFKKSVGFGDFAPITKPGRFLVIVIIFTSFIAGSIQLNRLIKAIGCIRTSIGVLPSSSDRYILFWGPLLPNQLLAVCRSLEASYGDFINSIVVLSSLPIEEYRNVYSTINKYSNIKICITGGSSKLATPSNVSNILLCSIMTIVVNDILISDDDLIGYDDNIADICDQDAILRLTSILNYSNQTNIPIALQISNAHYNSYLSSMDFVNVICILDLTNAFMAKSVMCKGLFYLILSLFFIPHDMDRAKNYVEYCCSVFYLDEPVDENNNSNHSLKQMTSQMLSMLKGMQYHFYRMPFSPCMIGLKFGELVRMLYMYNGSVLVGIIQQDGVGFLCPWNYIIGQESEYQTALFYGVVLAQSINDIFDMMLIEKIPSDMPNSEYNFDLVRKSLHMSKLEAVYENYKSPDSIEFEFDNYKDAVEYFNNDYPFIIVCGWPSSLDGFLMNILPDRFNAIILSPNKRELSENMIGRVAYIKGSGLFTEDLVNSGLYDCYSLIIFNCNHFIRGLPSTYQSNNNTKNEKYSNLMTFDHQAIFIRSLVTQTLNRAKDKTDFTSNRLVDMETCHIITEINKASSIEFFDVTFTTSLAASAKLDFLQKAWDSSSEFILSHQVTTGTVFVREMLYGLIAHFGPICQYSVDPNFIYTLLGINLRHDASEKQKFNVEQHLNHGVTSGSISLEKIPLNMIGKMYKTLFMHMLCNSHSICIGIYRIRTGKITKFSNGIVIASPQPNFLLQKSDHVRIFNEGLHYKIK